MLKAKEALGQDAKNFWLPDRALLPVLAGFGVRGANWAAPPSSHPEWLRKFS